MNIDIVNYFDGDVDGRNGEVGDGLDFEKQEDMARGVHDSAEDGGGYILMWMKASSLVMMSGIGTKVKVKTLVLMDTMGIVM